MTAGIESAGINVCRSRMGQSDYGNYGWEQLLTISGRNFQ